MPRPDDTIQFLQERQSAGEVFRVWDVGPFVTGQAAYGNNILAIHGIEQMGGHHGNEMRYYDRLIGGDDAASNAVASELRLLQRANVEYVVSPQRLQVPGLTEVFVGQRSAVYRMADVLPRAYLAGSAEVVSDEAALERMLAPEFDASTVLLAEPLPADAPAPQAGVQGSVSWEQRSLNRMTLRVSADRPAVLVILDNYYPAWHAHVGDDDAPLVRANLAFRAIPVPAGEHEVSISYVPAALHTGAVASMSLLLLLAVIGVGGVMLDARGRGSARRGDATT